MILRSKSSKFTSPWNSSFAVFPWKWILWHGEYWEYFIAPGTLGIIQSTVDISQEILRAFMFAMAGPSASYAQSDIAQHQTFGICWMFTSMLVFSPKKNVYVSLHFFRFLFLIFLLFPLVVLFCHSFVIQLFQIAFTSISVFIDKVRSLPVVLCLPYCRVCYRLWITTLRSFATCVCDVRKSTHKFLAACNMTLSDIMTLCR